jgi:hypothetical protein
MCRISWIAAVFGGGDARDKAKSRSMRTVMTVTQSRRARIAAVQRVRVVACLKV